MPDNRSVGRAGEFLAAYILETFGVEVHHVDRSGSDLWCKVGDALSTVQVKATMRPKSSNKRCSSVLYEFATTNKDADWFCFVALDQQLLLMYPSSEIVSNKTRLKPSLFNEGNQRRTIEEFVDGFG